MQEAGCEHFKEKNANYGKQSIDLVKNESKGLNNNNVNRPRPMKTYYFGEPVEIDYPVINQQSNSTIVNHDNNDSTSYRLSTRLPVDDLLRSKLINPLNHNRGHLIEQFNPSINHHDSLSNENFSRSLNCLNDQQIINKSFDKLFDPSSRTDLFQVNNCSIVKKKLIKLASLPL